MPKDLNQAFDLNNPKSVIEVQFSGSNITNKVYPIKSSEIENEIPEISSSQENDIATIDSIKQHDVKKVINLERQEIKR